MQSEHLGMRAAILNVDLKAGVAKKETLPSEVYRKYMGGTSLGLYLMLRDGLRVVDPLSPNNRLVFVTSVSTGAPISGQGRHTVMARSPLTGGLADSQCGGWWGAELKFAGYDAVILENGAPSWTYILIKDNDVQFLSAEDLTGQTTGEVDEILRERHGKKVRVMQIGPAGENLVRYAMITNDLKHFAGRGGLGAVMGSKKVRAIVVEGTRRPLPVHDSGKLKEISRWFSQSIKSHPALSLHHKLGTMKGVVPLSEAGLLPTFNFQDGSFDSASKVSGEALDSELGAGTHTCFGCAVACKRVVEGSNGRFSVSKQYGGPEYETLSTIGTSLGIDDIYGIAKSNELCNALGLDTISTGGTLAWATECFEKGLITELDTDGVVFRWNDPETNHKVIEMIARRNGVGDLLAEGSVRAAHKIGRGAEAYAMTVKKQEFPGHEPRGKWGVALGYAVSPTGADHLRAAHDVWFDKPGDYTAEYAWVDIEDLSPLGITEPVPSESLGPDKIRMYVNLQHVWALHDVIDWCIFTTVPEFRAISLNSLVDIVNAITGWRTSLYELLKAGERAVTMSRCYNILHGFTEADDTLPERMFEPMRSGTLKGHSIDRTEFTRGRKLYYGMMGWDDSGKPTLGKLEELGVGWMWDLLEQGEVGGI